MLPARLSSLFFFFFFCIRGSAEKNPDELFVASLLVLSLSLSALSSWLTGDNYAPLSSYCQDQFATQIKWDAFEERGGDRVKERKSNKEGRHKQKQ